MIVNITNILYTKLEKNASNIHYTKNVHIDLSFLKLYCLKSYNCEMHYE